MIDTDHWIGQVVAAHGSADRWAELSAIEVVVSARGLLFAAKSRPALNRVTLRVSTTTPHLTTEGYPRPGFRGEWSGEDWVRIVDPSGAEVARRNGPRAAFRQIRRTLWWDELDLLYFSSYAFWNYFTTPFHFSRPGFVFSPLPSAPGAPTRVRVRFPPDYPSHGREQVFHFAPNGEILRLDYTAEVVGAWATAAHRCLEYQTFDGFRVPTIRRVTPRVFGSPPLPGPLLVAIEVHGWRAIRG